MVSQFTPIVKEKEGEKKGFLSLFEVDKKQKNWYNDKVEEIICFWKDTRTEKEAIGWTRQQIQKSF